MAAAVAEVRASNATAPDARWTRERLLALAAKEASKLARIEDVVSARPLAALIQAGVCAARGDADAAIRLYAAAETGLRAVDMSLHAGAALHRLGEVAGGEEGAARCSQARAWATGEGVRQPERMLAVFGPG